MSQSALTKHIVSIPNQHMKHTLTSNLMDVTSRCSCSNCRSIPSSKNLSQLQASLWDSSECRRNICVRNRVLWDSCVCSYRMDMLYVTKALTRRAHTPTPTWTVTDEDMDDLFPDFQDMWIPTRILSKQIWTVLLVHVLCTFDECMLSDQRSFTDHFYSVSGREVTSPMFDEGRCKWYWLILKDLHVLPCFDVECRFETSNILCLHRCALVWSADCGCHWVAIQFEVLPAHALHALQSYTDHLSK